MNTSIWVFAEVHVKVLNFVDLRFVAKVTFSSLNSTRKFTSMETLSQNFVISFFTLT